MKMTLYYMCSIFTAFHLHLRSLILLLFFCTDEKYFGKRRNIAAWSIAFVCIGVLGLASAASAERLPRSFHYLISYVCTTRPAHISACLIKSS